MTFKNLLISSSFGEVAKYLKRISKNAEKSIKGYELVYNTLTELKERKQNKWWLKVDKTKSVNAYKSTKADSMAHSIMYAPWAKVLGMEVSSDFNVDFTVACILFELTWADFDEASIQKRALAASIEVDEFNKACETDDESWFAAVEEGLEALEKWRMKNKK